MLVPSSFLALCVSRLLLLGRLVPMTEMPTMRQIQPHQPIMRPHDRLVDLQVRRRPAQTLHIDPPLLCVQIEGLQRTSLARQLDGVDVLVAAVVAGTRVALAVFVGHRGAEGVEDSAGGDILGGDEDDGFALAFDFLFLQCDSLCNYFSCQPLDVDGGVSYHDLRDFGVGFDQGLLEHLCQEIRVSDARVIT